MSKVFLGFIVINSMFNLFMASGAEARNLSSLELFRRCYGQVTQKLPKHNDPLLLQVKSGTKTPVAACLEVLNHALFAGTGGNRLANTSDPLAVQVLNTFNQLHQSWFIAKELPTLDFPLGLLSTNDPGEPSLYFTKALFSTGVPVSYVLTGNENLRADRVTNNPATSTYGITEAQTVFAGSPNYSFASIGSLLGVKPTGNLPVTAGVQTGNLGATRGGGVLGSATYLLTTVSEPIDFSANTATMPRKWARDIFHDFLCRDLPVIRPADSVAFVSSLAAANEFRKSAACTQCHASMDRMAAVNRNFKYHSIPQTGAGTPSFLSGGLFVDVFPTNPALNGDEWPAVPTPGYNTRPTHGVLYYRDYTGVLVNKPVTSIANLGLTLSQSNDFYLCLAKRYYEYFIGVSVDIFDPLDPRYRNKGDVMNTHHQNVINLGLSLKASQSLPKLIQNILNLPIYRTSNSGVTF